MCDKSFILITLYNAYIKLNCPLRDAKLESYDMRVLQLPTNWCECTVTLHRTNNPVYPRSQLPWWNLCSSCPRFA